MIDTDCYTKLCELKQLSRLCSFIIKFTSRRNQLFGALAMRIGLQQGQIKWLCSANQSDPPTSTNDYVFLSEYMYFTQ